MNIRTVNTGITRIKFQNSHTVYENFIKCSIKDYEFNSSYNPTLLSGSQAILFPFSSSLNGDVFYNVTGSKYFGILKDFVTGSISGSEFSPYVTAVGLYNDAQELLAIAKLSAPMPISSNSDMTFLVKYDTQWTPKPYFTPTPTPTPSADCTLQGIATLYIAPSLSPSATPSVSITPSISLTPSISETPSITPSISTTPSISATPSITPSITVSPSITATPSLTPTPSPSIPAYVYAGTTSNYANAVLACNAKTCSRAWYRNAPSWAIGQTVYDDFNLTIPYNGGGNWIAVATSVGTFCGGGWAAIQVNSSGTITDFITCP